jgi:hypothetical protein
LEESLPVAGDFAPCGPAATQQSAPVLAISIGTVRLFCNPVKYTYGRMRSTWPKLDTKLDIMAKLALNVAKKDHSIR